MATTTTLQVFGKKNSWQNLHICCWEKNGGWRQIFIEVAQTILLSPHWGRGAGGEGGRCWRWRPKATIKDEVNLWPTLKYKHWYKILKFGCKDGLLLISLFIFFHMWCNVCQPYWHANKNVSATATVNWGKFGHGGDFRQTVFYWQK